MSAAKRWYLGFLGIALIGAPVVAAVHEFGIAVPRILHVAVVVLFWLAVLSTGVAWFTSMSLESQFHRAVGYVGVGVGSGTVVAGAVGLLVDPQRFADAEGWNPMIGVIAGILLVVGGVASFRLGRRPPDS